MRKDERGNLEPWADAFNSFFDQALVFRPICEDVPNAPDDLQTILFPDVVRPQNLIGGTGHFSHQPGMCTYVRSLGFEWNQEGRICATPTPSTFRWLIAQGDRPDAGYAPTFYVEDQDYLSVGPWLGLYLDGEIPLHVRSEEQYARWLPSSKGMHSDRHGFHLGSLLHDMTVHMLNYHLVPREWIERTSSKIKEAMPERVQAWNQEVASGPLTLSFFFDNDLNVYCFQVWCRCREPGDFEEIFLKRDHVEMIDKALDLRIEQTLEGKGDVPSGDTNDVDCLKPFSFHLP